MSQSYQIKLPQFEGPFDLLLFFIERDELDIYNIPINKLTKDFLDYVKSLEQLNIELASEFILFASTLMRIKAKLLLPRRQKDEEGNEIDPRQELIDKLLAYKRFKDASEQMIVLEAERLLQVKRGNIRAELDTIGQSFAEGTEIQTVTLYKLMKSFQKVINRFNDKHHKPQHVVMKYNYSMDSQKQYLEDHLNLNNSMTFVQLYDLMSDKLQAIFTLLALLELVQEKEIKISMGEGRNNFILEKYDKSLEEKYIDNDSFLN